MEFEFPGPKGVLNLTATVAALDLGGNQRGSILVVEDVTEFLRAQRQAAWKEVAQRVAHEIKNPLTPIGLSAERIRKHIDRSTGGIARCDSEMCGSNPRFGGNHAQAGRPVCRARPVPNRTTEAG